MNRFYAFMFFAIGLFNMFVGVIMYTSNSYKIDNFFSKLLDNSPNILPIVIFCVGLLYFLIGFFNFNKKSASTKK